MSKESENVVKEEKNDNKKKGNGLLVTILVIILLAVFFGFGYGLGGTKVVEKVVSNNTEKHDNNTDNSNAFRTIDADSLVTNLWKRVNFTAMSMGHYGKDVNADGLKVSEMSDDLKGILASTYYENAGKDVANKLVVSEKDVQYGYDSLFGAGTYKSGQDIYGVCYGKLNYTYDSQFKQYSAPAPACGGTSLASTIEEIVKVERNSSQLKITSANAVFRYDKNILYKSYADFDNDKAVEEYSGDKDNVGEYLKTNADSFTKYVYTFDVDANGFYKYVGYKKVEE